MITRIFEEKNKTLMLIGKASVVLYLCLFFALTLFTDSAYAPEITMLSLWGIFCCYFFGFQSIKKDAGKTIKPILFFSAIFYIIMFFVVPPTSSDFYHYYFEDYVWTQEKLNPYFFSPNDLFLNPSAQFTHWPDLAAQHGPMRSLLMAPATWLGDGIFWVSLFWYKVIFLLFVGILFFACYKILPLLGIRELSRAMFLLSWNPLILYEAMTASGTDVIMIALLLLSILFLFYKRLFISAVFLAFSVMTKYITIFCAPFMVWYIYKNYSWKSALKYFLIFLLASLLSFASFWEGKETLNSLFYVISYFESNSLIGLIYIYLTFFGLSITGLVWQQITMIAFLVLYFISGVHVFFKSNFSKRDLMLWCTVALGLFLALAKIWFYVKYLIWLIPLLIILDKKFDSLTIFLTGLAVFGLVFTPVFTLLLIPPILTMGGYRVAKNYFKLA